MSSRVSLLILIIIATACGPAPVPETQESHVYLPLVINSRSTVLNGSFEDGQWDRSVWWDWPWSSPHYDHSPDIQPPKGWVAWWVENGFCIHAEDYRTRQPEVTLVTDPMRVADGKQAMELSTVNQCHVGGIYQVLSLPPGVYRFGALAHYSYSDCLSRPYGLPLRKDCKTPINPYNKAIISLGVDSMGGIYYGAENISWRRYEQYGHYGDTLLWSPWVETTGQLTLWVKGETSIPLDFNNLYVDQITLEEQR